MRKARVKLEGRREIAGLPVLPGLSEGPGSGRRGSGTGAQGPPRQHSQGHERGRGSSDSYADFCYCFERLDGSPPPAPSCLALQGIRSLQVRGPPEFQSFPSRELEKAVWSQDCLFFVNLYYELAPVLS